jgi:hypothetical protein
MMNLDLTPAERNEITTRNLCENIKTNFLEVGRLLYANLTEAYWSLCGHSSFSDYLESLGIASRSKLSRLMNVAMCIETQVLQEADVLEMGQANAELLLPVIRRGELTQDLIEIAKSGSTRELRRALGHKENENDRNFSVICGNCGFEINGAKWMRKEKVDAPTMGID